MLPSNYCKHQVSFTRLFTGCEEAENPHAVIHVYHDDIRLGYDWDRLVDGFGSATKNVTTPVNPYQYRDRCSGLKSNIDMREELNRIGALLKIIAPPDPPLYRVSQKSGTVDFSVPCDLIVSYFYIMH